MTKQKPETTRRTSATYRRSQAEKGLVQVAVWVPMQCKVAVQAYARDLCKKRDELLKP